ncbi:uncharacterized protein prr14 [Hippoglossus hippoglossus]|uniref:uncharacterized protein prr14 n=1 Tax=Hippoglossus hippoglossus TaxID=8267 RepID=UPI00148CD1F7|nr:uncharacterized protein prr14 [Hippoglossus hippoglossus]
MDEDAIPPNPFCSAPPHSEPPPPLLPLSSVTPSCTNDGISGHRRSGHIQGIGAETPKKQSTADGGATPPTSRQSPSPSKRQRESESMVQVSQSTQLIVESTENKDGFDSTLAAEHQNSQKDQISSSNEPKVSAAENVVEQAADNTTQNLDASKSDIGLCRGLAVEHTVEDASAPKGWVIGPLFQSLKSKMASFTEIVMSPVKLFRANSPPLSMDHGPDGTSDAELSNMFQPIGQSETGNQEAEVYQQRLSEEEGAQNATTSALEYSRKLAFDINNSEEADECAITLTEKNLPDSVPLKDIPGPCSVSKQVSESVGSVVRSSTLSQASLTLSASHESSLKTSGVVEEQEKQAVRPKPLPTKRTGNRSESKKVISKPFIWEVNKEQNPDVSDEHFSQRSSVQSNKADFTQLSSSSVCQLDTDGLQPDDNIMNIESCSSERESLLNNLNDSATGRTLKSTLETRQLENLINPDTDSAAGVRRSKRGLKLFQETVKRKKLRDYTCSEDIKSQESLKVAAESGILRGLRPPRKEVVLMNTTVDGEETLKPLRKRQAASTRANRKGKVGQEMLPAINEAMSNTQTENSPDAMLVCSLDKSSGVSENHQKGGSSKTKPSSCKRLKTRSGFGKPDVNIDSMDLETTVAITSTRQVQPEPLSNVFIHPDKKQLQSMSKCRNTTKKPLKRKSPIQASSTTESDSTLVSNLSIQSALPFELTPTDSKTSPPTKREENLKTGPNRQSKRPKKGFRGAVKSSESSETQESKQCIDDLHLITKDCQCKDGRCKSTMDPVYFEMTPFESNHEPDSSPAQSHLGCFVQLNNEIKHLIDNSAKSPFPVADEVLLSDTEASNHCYVSRLRSSTRRVNIQPRRADNQRRRCRVLRSRTHKGEEMTNSITMEDTDLVTGGTRSSEVDFTRGLLRSYSCPEILSLHPFDTPWTTSVHYPHQSRTRSSNQHHSSHTPPVPHANKFLRRARRHTVCSIEVEREIAPLCLRKEVYPSRRSAPYDGVNPFHSATHSPSTSLSALASCFLSSPLAFLSRKVCSRGAAASPSTSCHISSPISSLLTSPVSSFTRHLPGFLQRSDSSLANLDSCISGNPLECETERRQQSEEEEDDGEDTSSSSHEYEDVGLREEKALSDSEIKVVQKHEERGKVSSIRIRKTLPKPQNNLTPMGLPKPIRLKKKEFSLEEIYTNKNFSKPPESRLETIFEVPLNRQNGSESWFGQRRFKRFLEFLEVGEARKPKRPLVGVGKATSSSSRTRRGSFTKDEPSLSVQDVDSLLCAKLDQLNLWLIHDDERETAD